MKISLSTIDAMLENFADNHAQINQYKNAPEKEIKAADLKYPLMWVMFGKTKFEQGTVNPIIKVMFLDRVAEDSSNFVQSLSDTLLTAYDFYTEFNENEEKYGIEFDVDLEVEPIVMDYDDKVNGWTADISCQVRGYRNELQIPWQN